MSRFPKSRVDALSDGVFAFAMTLLALDIRLPDDLPIASAAELWTHLLGLSHQMLTYVISFFVLGVFWRGGTELRPSAEHVNGGVVRLSLLLLFFVTMVPFSSALVGRYGAFAPAAIIYAGNMIVLGGLSTAMRYLDVPADQRSLAAAAGTKMPLFIATACLSAVLSLFVPHLAMYAYLLNWLSRLPPFRTPRRG